MRFHRAVQLFAWLGPLASSIGLEFSKELAQQKIETILVQLGDEDFSILLDLFEMFETEAGKKLIDIDLAGLKKELHVCKAIRQANKGARLN